jgi:hypothetical protein
MPLNPTAACLHLEAIFGDSAMTGDRVNERNDDVSTI